jgi:hypothetical protein
MLRTLRGFFWSKRMNYRLHNNLELGTEHAASCMDIFAMVTHSPRDRRSGSEQSIRQNGR